jgi:photosystem II stability/assembly factor-like uncharacterized protein
MHGFCCRNGELFETVEPECLEIGGMFHFDPAIVEQACETPPHHAVAAPHHEKIQPGIAVKSGAQPQTAPVGKVQKIPDFLLVDRILELDPMDRWVKTGGPIGGLGYDVRYRANDTRSQNIMYVTDNYSGVNISTNGGKNWFAANQGIDARTGSSLDAIPVFSLTVDPNNPDIVWVGLKDVSTAYKSINGGKNWAEVPPKPNRFPKIDAKNDFVFRGFTIQPGNSNVVYAAGEVPQNDMGEAFDRVRGRVYRTTDGGNSWKILWEGKNLARYVIIHPYNHNILYVSTGIFDREAANSECKGCSAEAISQTNTIGCRGGVGVLKSTDGGATWRELGIGNGLTDLYVGSLVMHPSNPDILLAGAGNNSCSDHWLGGKFRSTGGVFLSVDGGETWTKTLSNQTITSVEFAPSSHRNEYDIAYAAGRARFHRSTDGGKSWTAVGRKNYPWGPPGAFSGFPIDILVDPDDANTVFANNYGGGNVKSTDGGENWTIASQGYTGALMFDVEMHPSNSGIIYAAARSGLFRSGDGGRSWQGLSNPPARFPESYSVALHPYHPNIVLASQELSGTLYRSTDGGNAWQEVFKLPISGDVSGMYGFKRIVFAPSAQHVVYAASCRSNNHLNDNPTAFGVYVSKNSGKKKSWVKANGAQLGNKAINDLAVHLRNHNIVWAATASDGLWRTANGGASWQKMSGLPPKDVRAVALDPKNPNLVYAGARMGGVYKGVPGTKGTWTWHKMAAGMHDEDNIYSLVVDPSRPSRVWAGSLNTGVRYWDQIEQQWIVFNRGLEMRSVYDLTISNDGKTLYAATHGGGVYRLRLSK